MNFTPIRVFLYISVLLLNSCNRGADQSLLYTVFESDFTNDIVIEGTVEAVRSVVVTCPPRLDGTIVYLVEDGTMVKKGDTICIIENRQLENHYEDLLMRVEQFESQYSRGLADLNMSYALMKAQVESNEALLSITRLDTAQLDYLTEQQRRISELQLERALIEREKLERKLEFTELINESELRRLKLQINQQISQANSVKDRLEQLIITAPQNGLAMRAIHRQSNEKVKEGDHVWQTLPLIQLPDLTEVRVTIMASENDYKRISVSDSIVYTFNSMPGNMAWGRILRKSPVGRPISRDSRVRLFEITASVDSFKTIPDIGISANSRIVLSHKSNVLTVPQLAINDNDSVSYVYVKIGNNYELREIFRGESSMRDAIVLAGLNPYEVVSLKEPQSQNIVNKVYLSDSVKQLLKSQIVEIVDSVDYSNGVDVFYKSDSQPDYNNQDVY